MRRSVVQFARRGRPLLAAGGVTTPIRPSRGALLCLARRGLAAEAGASEKHAFKAETSRLLDIVTNSIYTDKEIFLREIVSNAADALEKLRHLRVSGEETVTNADVELAVTLETDAEAGTLTVSDNGVGMTRQEMLDNLGTIARSGSRAFAEKAAATGGSDAAKNVIGQFGVGFYSTFMVGHTIEVYSRSSVGGPDAQAHLWRSTGSDDFTIQEVDGAAMSGFGTKIVIHLKDEAKKAYTDAAKIKGIVQRYSNYVGFPVSVDGERANEVSAIWTRDKKDVTEIEYDEFYRFVAKAFDRPLLNIHFRTDAPIDLKALMFVPTTHAEKMNMGRLPPGVSLYSRKVLLEANSERLLPTWLRFIKGVVDSDDLPISISRESMQDSQLLSQISRAVTRRVIKGLEKLASDDPATYDEKFFPEFGNFMKEGVCTDAENFSTIGKLLRFPSSQADSGKLVSLDAYVSRCKPEQDKVYYLTAPSRELALQSPYYEVFKRAGVEVLFMYNSIDDFVMGNLREFNGRRLVAAESGDVDLSKILNRPARDPATGADAEAGRDGADEEAPQVPLPKEEAEALTAWLQTELPDQLRGATVSTRLRDSPAVVVDFESASVRRMMRMVQQGNDGSTAAAEHVGRQQLELNTGHPIVQEMNKLRSSDPALARALARQVVDNALVAAGLVEDPRVMLPRLNVLLSQLLAHRKQ